VSFFMVSTTVLDDESVFTESELAEPLPLQAANEVATAKAKKAILNEFFMFLVLSDYVT
jgi:hypothetical protein